MSDANLYDLVEKLSGAVRHLRKSRLHSEDYEHYLDELLEQSIGIPKPQVVIDDQVVDCSTFMEVWSSDQNHLVYGLTPGKGHRRLKANCGIDGKVRWSIWDKGGACCDPMMATSSSWERVPENEAIQCIKEYLMAVSAIGGSDD